MINPITPRLDFSEERSFSRQQFLYLRPLPQGQGSLRSGVSDISGIAWCWEEVIHVSDL